MNPDWRFVSHLNVHVGRNRNKHYLMHRDNDLGVQREIISVMDEYGMTCYRSETSYFIDGDDSEYHTEEEMLLALEKRTAEKRKK